MIHTSPALYFLEPCVRGFRQQAARFPRSRRIGVRVAHQRKALDRTLRLVHLELDPAACRSRLKGLEGAPVLAVSVREERREREVEDVAREVLQAHVGGPDGGVGAVEARCDGSRVVERGEVGNDGLTVGGLALGGAEGDGEITVVRVVSPGVRVPVKGRRGDFRRLWSRCMGRGSQAV